MSTTDYLVYCHLCDVVRREDGTYEPLKAIMRSEARRIGSPEYGGLWHCREHWECLPQGTPRACPLGSWTDPIKSDGRIGR